mgnify:CR=1 FL=1|tara:strand:- start:21 stop:1709 length:1689 start_codon:yes stop_codon:yes gene_type:complete
MLKNYNAFPILNNKVLFPGEKQKLILKANLAKLIQPVMNLRTQQYEILLVYPQKDSNVSDLIEYPSQDYEYAETQWKDNTKPVGIICNVTKAPGKGLGYHLTATDRFLISSFFVTEEGNMFAEGSLLEVPEKSGSFEMLINSIIKSGHPLVGDLIQSSTEDIKKLSPSIPCSFAYDIASVVLNKEQKSLYLQMQCYESFCTSLSTVVEKILGDKPSKPPAIVPVASREQSEESWDIELFQGSQEAKDVIQKQMKRLDRLMPTSQEHAQISDWLDLVFSLPINAESQDTMSIDKVRSVLDHSHYGLEEVKQEILEYVVVRQHAPMAPEKIMLFDGPPGTGKTIMAEAISKSLGRKLIKISMGSITEPSQIVGDRRVYLGSSIGKLIHSLIRAKTDKLVILLDEIDKIGRSHKGDPTAVLLDALDPKQNHSFVDNYLGFPVNLKNVMFICTSNDWSKIPKPLYDRMNMFAFKEYSMESKKIIASKYILPKLCDVYNFDIRLTEAGNNLLCKNVNLREIEQRLCKIVSHYIFQSRIFDKHPPEKLSEKDVDSIINKNTKTKRVGF